MRLSISHTTRYAFATPPSYGLQQLRLTPAPTTGQDVRDWQLEVAGARVQAEFSDHHGNLTQTLVVDDGADEIRITSCGVVDMTDLGGVLGDSKSPAPLWLYRCGTPRTEAGDGVRALADTLPDVPGVADLHALSARIAGRVVYETGRTAATTTAEGAIELGYGVCQDHAHIFIAALRHRGHAARYVSGYLMMNDRVVQDATHAWAEAWVEGLGWTGFDVSNGISPDARYVRLACGLDYAEAAPISGLLMGAGGESISVDVRVEQQQLQQQQSQRQVQRQSGQPSRTPTQHQTQQQ